MFIFLIYFIFFLSLLIIVTHLLSVSSSHSSAWRSSVSFSTLSLAVSSQSNPWSPDGHGRKPCVWQRGQIPNNPCGGMFHPYTAPPPNSSPMLAHTPTPKLPLDKKFPGQIANDAKTIISDSIWFCSLPWSLKHPETICLCVFMCVHYGKLSVILNAILKVCAPLPVCLFISVIVKMLIG